MPHTARKLAAVDARREPVTRRALSSRMQEVACLIADGRTNKEIAATLHIAPETVRTYMRQIVQRLALPSGDSRVLIARTVLQMERTS